MVENESNVSASFVDYEGDIHHDEIMEGLDASSNYRPEDCEVNVKLSVAEKDEILQLKEKHQYVFSNKPEAAKMVVHKIPVTTVTNTPIVTSQYKVPFLQRKDLAQELQEMESMGIMRRRNSPYSYPTVVVQKKDRS